MDIYVTETIGTEGAERLYKENEAFLKERFPGFFIRRIEELFAEENKKNTQATAENMRDFLLANDSECIYIDTITDGGIFGALWKACSGLKCGCEVDVKKIPVRQEVVEISELFDENPYEADSSGSLLIIGKLVSCEPRSAEEYEAQARNIRFTKIGETTNKKDRVVINGGSRRFLTPPERQDKDIKNRKALKQ